MMLMVSWHNGADILRTMPPASSFSRATPAVSRGGVTESRAALRCADAGAQAPSARHPKDYEGAAQTMRRLF